MTPTHSTLQIVSAQSQRMLVQVAHWRQILLAIVLPLVGTLLTRLIAGASPNVTYLLFIGFSLLIGFFGSVVAGIISAVWSSFLIEVLLWTMNFPLTNSPNRLIWHGVFVGIVYLLSRLQETLKQSNIALATTTNQLNTILNAIEDAVTVQDTDGRFIFSNDAATRLTRMDASKIKGLTRDDLRTMYTMTDPEGRRLTLDEMPFARALRTAARAHMLFRSKGPFVEKERWMDMTAVPVLDAHGKPQFIVNIIRDVTLDQEAQEQEKALRAKIVEQAHVINSQRRRLEDILNSVPVMVWEGEGDPDTGQRMVFVNRYGQELLGYTLEEWSSEPGVGRQWIHPDDLAAVDEKTSRNYHAGASEPVEFRFIAKDGRLIHVEARANIMYDDDGKPTGARGIMLDVTDRTRAEEALRRSNEELQQFAYVASHDLQEPLRMVTSYLQLLEERNKDRLDDEGREFIAYAVDGASRMKALINDLLAHSRVQTNRERFVPVDLNEVVKGALLTLDAAIRAQNATVTVATLPTITGNANMMAQLFQNLISNALKFRSEQPLTIDISVQEGRAGWTFAVKDNGIGIDPKQAERIFLIFQRLHSRSKYPGTGIGLAIAKKVIERHHGNIWVESQKGMGATFFFTIPFRHAYTDVRSTSPL